MGKKILKNKRFPSILPGLRDYVFKSGVCRGEVVNVAVSPNERVCYVYGNTLEEMRKRKQLIYKLLRKEEGDPCLIAKLNSEE